MLLGVLVPALIFVLISFGQFWIPATAHPARVAMALLPILINITLFARAQESLPHSSERIWLEDFLTGGGLRCGLRGSH